MAVRNDFFRVADSGSVKDEQIKVTITLAEYRSLIVENATLEQRVTYLENKLLEERKKHYENQT